MIASGYAFSLNDMMVRFPYDKCKSLSKYSKNKRKSLIKKIFKESIKLIVDDVIENDATFRLPPMGIQLGEIHMELSKGEDFIKLRKLGKFKDVDFLESLFTGYTMFLYMKTRNDTIYARKRKPIHLNKKYGDKITFYTNLGKSYSG